IKPHFNIVNTGTSSVPLSELKIRYWFTREGTAGQNFWCDWSAVGCSNLSGAFVSVNPARTGANFYLEVSFTAAAGSIPAGGQSGEIQARFAKSDWSNYTETGDYSFDPTKVSFADWTHVTLYRNGVLVWGTEP
ncbi:MAG: cellulose binding domain-containing protein, partial [Anaerolineales bacterium]